MREGGSRESDKPGTGKGSWLSDLSMLSDGHSPL